MCICVCLCACVLCDRKNNLLLIAQGLILMLYTTSETNFYFPSIPSLKKKKPQQKPSTDKYPVRRKSQKKILLLNPTCDLFLYSYKLDKDKNDRLQTSSLKTIKYFPAKLFRIGHWMNWMENMKH